MNVREYQRVIKKKHEQSWKGRETNGTQEEDKKNTTQYVSNTTTCTTTQNPEYKDTQ